MERKTKVHAQDGKQEIWIDREFDIPVEALFRAHTQAEIVAQWMGTKVQRLDNHPLGSYSFETTDSKGNKHLFQGCIHSLVPNQRISRTFEMVSTDFPEQMEYLVFEALDSRRSRLSMQMVYKSVEVRDKVLKLPFVQGINMAHDRLQEVAEKHN